MTLLQSKVLHSVQYHPTPSLALFHQTHQLSGLVLQPFQGKKGLLAHSERLHHSFFFLRIISCSLSVPFVVIDATFFNSQDPCYVLMRVRISVTFLAMSTLSVVLCTIEHLQYSISPETTFNSTLTKCANPAVEYHP